MNSERCRIMFVATELRPELIPTHSGRRSAVCYIYYPYASPLFLSFR